MSACMIGGSVVMLHPRGLLDMEYLSNTIEKCGVTFLPLVPSLARPLFEQLQSVDWSGRSEDSGVGSGLNSGGSGGGSKSSSVNRIRSVNRIAFVGDALFSNNTAHIPNMC